MAAPPKAAFSIAVLENAGHEVLLLKRAPHLELGAGLWGFPAGHIEPGESADGCARRELAEEIGSDHDVTLQHSLGPIRDSLYGGIYEIHLFHFHWLRGSIELNDEHTACAWVDMARYRDYAVMNGVDEDLYLLNVWPRAALNQAVLDDALARRRAAGEHWP